MKNIRSLLIGSAFLAAVFVAPVGAFADGPMTADFNSDGSVDGVDLTTWANNYGAGGGGSTEGLDFLSWQRQLGSTSGGDPGLVNPEPATLVVWGTLAGVAGLGVAARRRRERAAATL